MRIVKWLERLEEAGFKERQIKGFEYIDKNGSITSTKYAEINNVTKRTARKDLLEMMEEDIIEKIGKGKNIKYKPYNNALFLIQTFPPSRQLLNLKLFNQTFKSENRPKN